MQRRLAVGLLTAIGVFAGVQEGTANNVAVTNTDLKSPGSGTVKVEFDLSWDNSWRDGVNNDACWVFVKYSTDAGTNWSHATLAASGTNPPSFSTGTNTSLEIVVPVDKKGAFIQRASDGTGTVASADVQLVWNFATNNVLASQSARVKVFAVEMVYVPAGSFYVGDGTTNTIQGQFEAGTNGSPFLITNESYQVTLGGGAPGSLGNNNAVATADDFNDATSKTLLAAFPKGYAAFYLMKTEISQRQYCDFLNTLTRTQQNTRTESQTASNFVMTAFTYPLGGNAIRCPGSIPSGLIVFGCDLDQDMTFNETNDGQWVACNYLSWMDGAAYADWAAMRPMTELEFEKACRGTNSAVIDEYPWGNTNLETATTSLTNAGTAAEAPDQGNCNYGPAYGTGPYRCGSYARGSSDRQNAGAGYYGALDLSGNLYERSVTIGNVTGRGFTGGHGDGTLSVVKGNANETNWPGLVSGEVTTAAGACFRGGGCDGTASTAVYLRLSDRGYGAYVAERKKYYGWRGARSAP